VTGPAATATAIPRPGSQKESQRSWVEMVMGLPVSVTVRGPAARGPRADQVVHGVYAELHRADRVFSTYRTDSEVSLLSSGALARELASPDVQEVLDLCAQARELTGGSFDAEITQPVGQRLLDPSGLVKGWAVERAASGLNLLDGHDWLINAGGDVLGSAQRGPAWRVALEDPRNPNQVLCVLPLRRGAVATSSLPPAAATSPTPGPAAQPPQIACSAPPSPDRPSPGRTCWPPPPSSKDPTRSLGWRRSTATRP